MKRLFIPLAPANLRSLIFAALVALVGIKWTSATELPPTLVSHPIGKSVSIGANLNLQVTATGATPLNYQWQHNLLNVSGATNRSLNLTNVQLGQAGDYRVIVASGFGAVTSQVARLDVDPAFTKISSANFNLAGGASGVSWADYNNDGLQDLFIVGKGGATALCANQGDGTFVRLSSGTGIGSGGLGSASWADFDNDGSLDLFVGGASLLYRNNGNGTFSKAPFSAGGINSYCASWADFDNDGFVDLFLGNYFTGGANAFFRNNGNGTFTKLTNNILARDKGNSQGVSWCDYDNDGWSDLFVANTGGQRCFLYHNEGKGDFKKITNSPITELAGNFACGAWGDYDNDGFPDLFVCGYNQKHLLFHNNRDGTFNAVTDGGSITTDAGDDQTCGWVDYDNDGYLDLFVTSGGLTHGMQDFLYRNNGDGTFTKVTRGSLVNDNGEGGASAWGDFNRDGFPDLFVSNFQNVSTGDKENCLYVNNGNDHSWIAVKCEGRVSNRAGIGAKVRIKAMIHGQETWQLREISGGGAYVSQHSLEASFGLGSATNVDVVRIEWPSGIVQELRDIAAKRFLVIKEPSRVTAESFPEKGELHVSVTGGRGVIYGLESSNDLRNWISEGSLTNQTGTVSWTNRPSPIIRFFRAREL